MGISLKNIAKDLGTPPTHILRDINLDIEDGQFISLTGRSGSGKSTLLYILSSLDSPSSGAVEIDGRNVNAISKKELHAFRNEQMGFVFQFHYLLPELTALENILMPAMKTGKHKRLQDQAAALLGEFGLGDKLHRFPSQMSGGEQQRVAIARSLIMGPRYIFADEPTGNLDSANSETVMKILKRINTERKTTVLMVTHDPDFAALAERQVHLVDGRIVKQ